MYQYPTMHRPIEMNTEVIVPADYLGHEARGRVVGIASIHIIFHYIVLLSEPYSHPDWGQISALSIAGGQLMNLNREYPWCFDEARGETHMQYLKDMAAKHGKPIGSLGV